jgi:membrane protein DedA with SNARE-associated domain
MWALESVFGLLSPCPMLVSGIELRAPVASANSMHWVVSTVHHYLLTWGYWAVILGLLGENAGLPLPGETILIFASFLAFKHQHLHYGWIIVAGIAAATVGDNVGYWLGRTLGRRFLSKWKHIFHVDNQDIAAGEHLIKRRGDLTIYIARFIWGLRTIAGPLAGVLRMDWRRFALFNFLGAATWVGFIVLLGYVFGHEFSSLPDFFEKADIAIMVGVAVLGIYFWRRYKKKKASGSQGRQKAA